MSSYPPPSASLNFQLPLASMPWEKSERLYLDMVCEDAIFNREIVSKALKIPEILQRFSAASELIKIPEVFGIGRHDINRDETTVLQTWLDKELCPRQVRRCHIRRWWLLSLPR